MNPPAVEIHQCPVGQELHFNFRTKDGRELHSLRCGTVLNRVRSRTFSLQYVGLFQMVGLYSDQRSHYDRTSTLVVTTDGLPWSCYDIVVTTEQLAWSCYDIVGTIDQQPWSGFGNYLTHILLGDSYDLS